MSLVPIKRFAADITILFAGLTAGGSLVAAEPQVTFALKSGWVEFSIRQDGKPVAGAVAHVIDERGSQFAEGETGAEGDSAFPLPPGSSCIVEIKTGERTADPIRLTKTAAGVEPARILLSFGLRACCRIKRVRSAPVRAEPPQEPPTETSGFDVSAMLAILLGGAGTLATVYWLKQRYSTSPGLSAKMNA